MKRTVILFSILVISIFNSSFSTDRNVCWVLINSYDQLYVDYEVVSIKDLKDIVKEFIANPKNDYNYADKFEWEVPYLGKTQISKGTICVMCDRNTTYQKYIDVQNEIERAFNELRNELALEKFNTAYRFLNKSKQQAIDWAVPKNVTEPIYRKILKTK